MYKVFVFPDLHAPYHDQKAFKLALKAVKYFKPTHVVILGDWIDCLSVSFHPKSPDERVTLEEEVESANACLDAVQASVSDKTKVIFCEGNHEVRLARYIADKAPDLFGLVSMPILLGIKDRGWKWVPYKSSHKIGKMHYTHDVGRAGMHAAHQSLKDFGHNLTIGHTHRGQVIYHGNVRGEAHVCRSTGWLGDEKHVSYRHRDMVSREWQLGFGLDYIEPKGNVHSHFVPIINYRCVVEGKLLTA